MTNNFKESVTKAIAETQDGKMLVPSCTFSGFVIECIERNTKEESWVDIENLISDFKYMIHELKAAIKPLEEYAEKWENRIINEL